MAFIVIIFPPTSSTNPQCGQRHGLAGQFYFLWHPIHSRPLSFFTLISVFFPLFRFEDFGGAIHHRPVEDLAFAVARFIQKGGSFVNYYMVGISISVNSLI